MSDDSSLDNSDVDTDTEDDSEINLELNSAPEEMKVDLGADSETNWEQSSLRNDLKYWAIDNNITHSAIDNLLLILKKHCKDISVPLHSRTLLNTNREVVETTAIGNTGHYWHNGLKRNIIEIAKIFDDENIILSFNIDGLPIYKSSTKAFWPILCSIENIKTQPFVVGIYYGNGKPANLDDYLDQFVEELLDITVNGIIVNNRYRNCSIKYFVCDLPARSYVKGRPKCFYPISLDKIHFSNDLSRPN